MLGRSVDGSLGSSRSNFLLGRVCCFRSRDMRPVPLSGTTELGTSVTSSRIILQSLLRVKRHFYLGYSFGNTDSRGDVGSCFQSLLFVGKCARVGSRAERNLSMGGGSSTRMSVLLAGSNGRVTVCRNLGLSDIDAACVSARVDGTIMGCGTLKASAFVITCMSISSFSSF